MAALRHLFVEIAFTLTALAPSELLGRPSYFARPTRRSKSCPIRAAYGCAQGRFLDRASCSWPDHVQPQRQLITDGIQQNPLITTKSVSTSAANAVRLSIAFGLLFVLGSFTCSNRSSIQLAGSSAQNEGRRNL